MKRKRTMGAFTQAQYQKSINPGCEQRGYVESGHLLEKLEFALAVAIGSGDQTRIQELRTRIEALGDNREEPGT
jgi:hypothetical protein